MYDRQEAEETSKERRDPECHIVVVASSVFNLARADVLGSDFVIDQGPCMRAVSQLLGTSIHASRTDCISG